MRIISGTPAAAMRAFLLYLLIAVPAFAQTYTLSGKVTDSEGHAVPSAKVSAKNVASGQLYSAATGADGLYTIGDLAGGDYMVWATAGDLQAPPIKVTLAAAQTTDLTVSPASKGQKSFRPLFFALGRWNISRKPAKWPIYPSCSLLGTIIGQTGGS